MKYNTPDIVIHLFDSDIGTDSMSQIHDAGNPATQELENSSPTGEGARMQVFKFKWE